MTETYHEICGLEELGVGVARTAVVNGWPILVSRTDDAVRAIINRCSHADSPLEGGRVRRGMISCPLHGARFELATGKCIGAHYRPLRTFPTRVTEDRVEVAVPDEEPGPEHRPVRPPVST